jgi:SAM-dependent methyltransferase
MYDFVLSADVLEHVAPPVERALEETWRLLKPHGFLAVTIYCNAADRTVEHFPELNEFRVVDLGESPVLINRKRDGSLEITDNVVFHGGSGATLEMREFGLTDLKAKLRAAGFRDVTLLSENVPEFGILFDSDVSQPLIATKDRFVMDSCVRTQLVSAWKTAHDQAVHYRERASSLEAQVRFAGQSRWLRLGRKLGVGPRFT